MLTREDLTGLTGPQLASLWVRSRKDFLKATDRQRGMYPIVCQYSNGWYSYCRGDSVHKHSTRRHDIVGDILNWERRIAEEPARRAAEEKQREDSRRAWRISEAAPDLLAALETIWNSYARQVVRSDGSCTLECDFKNLEELNAAKDAIKSAIAKAKGAA